MKKLMKNEGFTLVELMIVLSIIAILAVVLVPKVGEMKDSVREQGVYSNMNSVRAYLELKINSRDTGVAAETTRLIDLLQKEFSYTNTEALGNSIINPFTNGFKIGAWNSAINAADHSVAIYGWNTTLSQVPANATFANNYDSANVARKGRIVVWVLQDGYLIWGHGADGSTIPYQIIK